MYHYAVIIPLMFTLLNKYKTKNNFRASYNIVAPAVYPHLAYSNC